MGDVGALGWIPHAYIFNILNTCVNLHVFTCVNT